MFNRCRGNILWLNKHKDICRKKMKIPIREQPPGDVDATRPESEWKSTVISIFSIQQLSFITESSLGTVSNTIPIDKKIYDR